VKNVQKKKWRMKKNEKTISSFFFQQDLARLRDLLKTALKSQAVYIAQFVKIHDVIDAPLTNAVECLSYIRKDAVELTKTKLMTKIHVLLW